jgi:hypothetical protein
MKLNKYVFSLSGATKSTEVNFSYDSYDLTKAVRDKRLGNVSPLRQPAGCDVI